MHNRLFIIVIFTIICLALGLNALGDNSQSKVSELKAAFLFNFAKFVQWPSDESDGNDTTFVIGIIGDNPFEGRLKSIIEGRRIRKQKVKVLEVNDYDSLETCNILFISSSDNNEFNEIIKVIADKPVLTVGEQAGFTKAGGIVNFYLKDNMVRFKINVKAAAKANLNISSKLLKLAELE